MSGLIRFVHVEDVHRSIDFYHPLESVYKYKGTPVWAELESDRAQLMVSTDGDSIDRAGHGVLFYLYSSELAALRDQLLGAGIDAGEIEDGTPISGHGSGWVTIPSRAARALSHSRCLLAGGGQRPAVTVLRYPGAGVDEASTGECCRVASPDVEL